MAENVDPLMREFLTWVAGRPRTYTEAMEAWRSNCPRHSVWDDALVGGLVQVASDGPERPPEVRLTARGQTVLNANVNL
jgi:hypothetical protein